MKSVLRGAPDAKVEKGLQGLKMSVMTESCVESWNWSIKIKSVVRHGISQK